METQVSGTSRQMAGAETGAVLERPVALIGPALDANIIVANAPDPVFVSDLEGKIL